MNLKKKKKGSRNQKNLSSRPAQTKSKNLSEKYPTQKGVVKWLKW
jgi:hypothetical protein